MSVPQIQKAWAHEVRLHIEFTYGLGMQMHAEPACIVRLRARADCIMGGLLSV